MMEASTTIDFDGAVGIVLYPETDEETEDIIEFMKNHGIEIIDDDE